MGELFGVVVTAVSALALFVIGAVQIAHRLVDGRIDPRLRVAVLPELEDVALGVVAGSGAAIAAGSQLPVAYLLVSGGVSAAAATALVVEVVIALAWVADLAGARSAARDLIRIGREHIRQLT